MNSTTFFRLALVCLLAGMLGGLRVSAQDEPANNGTPPAEPPAASASPGPVIPVADQGMPDITGTWSIAKDAESGRAMIMPDPSGEVDFLVVPSPEASNLHLRFKWSPAHDRFEAKSLAPDRNESMYYLKFDKDQKTLHYTAALDEPNRTLLRERGLSQTEIDQTTDQRWVRVLDANGRPDIVGTWSGAEGGTFLKLTIWPVENRDGLFFVDCVECNGLLEWKPEDSNFQGFFSLFDDRTVKASLIIGPKETLHLVMMPFEDQRHQLLRSGFAKTEQELDSKLSTELTHVEVPVDPKPKPTVAVVKTEFAPSRVRESLRAKYREQSYRFFSNDTYHSVIVLAPAEAQEDIEVALHQLDVDDSANRNSPAPVVHLNYVEQYSANQPQPISQRPEDGIPDVSGTWQYETPELPLQADMRGKASTMGSVSIRQTYLIQRATDPSIDFVLEDKTVIGDQPASTSNVPAARLKWSQKIKKFLALGIHDNIPSGMTFELLANGKLRVESHVDAAERTRLANQGGVSQSTIDQLLNQVWVRVPTEPQSKSSQDPLVAANHNEAIPKVMRAASFESPEMRRLQEQLQAQESAAAAEAATIRQLQANGETESNEQPIAEHQSKLRNLLSTAFDLKLQLEELQVKELQSRLSRLERQIGQRKVLREKIIERRSRELIEGDALKWDSATATSSTLTQGAGDSRNPTSATSPEVVKLLRDRVDLLFEEMKSGKVKAEDVLQASNELAQVEPQGHVERLKALIEIANRHRGTEAFSEAEFLKIKAIFNEAQWRESQASESTTTSRDAKSNVSDVEQLPLARENFVDSILAPLQGEWDSEQWTHSPTTNAIESSGQGTIATIRNDQILLQRTPEDSRELLWTIKVGAPGSRPQFVDLISERSDTASSSVPGILKVEGDVVQICHANSPTAPRPTVFNAGADAYLLTFKRRTPVPVTELEGDWHLVSSIDENGQIVKPRPMNRTFRGDHATYVFPGGEFERRIKVNPAVKTIWYHSKDEYNSFTMEHYELKGEQLLLRDSAGREEVFERGHVRIPNVVPPATEEQKLLWRSAIVEIVILSEPKSNLLQYEMIGHGVVVSSNGLILTQLKEGMPANSPLTAKFDDGSLVDVKIAEDAGNGLFALQPNDEVRINHFLPLGQAPHAVGDEVYVWGGDFAIGTATIVLTDRKVVTGPSPVWQISLAHDVSLRYCEPVLSAEGELAALTLMGTGELTLAVPATRLKEMFPKTLVQQP